MELLHALDSLTALPLLRESRSLADLGSGGGVPGVPLALARPDLRVTMLESRGRKAAALQSIVEALGLTRRVIVTPARGEQWLAQHSVDAVIARAVGRTPEHRDFEAPLGRSQAQHSNTSAGGPEAARLDLADAAVLQQSRHVLCHASALDRLGARPAAHSTTTDSATTPTRPEGTLLTTPWGRLASWPGITSHLSLQEGRLSDRLLFQ